MTKKERNVKLFKKAVQHWIDFFALKSFHVIIEESDSDGYLAACYWHGMKEEGGGERMFTIDYSNKWISSTNPDEIYRVAFHEVLEALLYKMHHFGENKTLIIPEREVNDAVHAIIRTMENCVLQYLPKD